MSETLSEKKYMRLGKTVWFDDLMYFIYIGLSDKSLFCFLDFHSDFYENEYHIIDIKNLKKKIKKYMMSNIKEVQIGEIIESNHWYLGTIGQFILKNKSLYLKYNQKNNNKLCYYHIITINNLLKKIEKYTELKK